MSDLRTPLYSAHAAAGAKIVPFAGWEMPLQYAGIRPEHAAVRGDWGMFDVSHMGLMRIWGPQSTAWLNRLCVSEFSTLQAGKVQYTLLCQEDGGAVDDLLVTRVAAEEWLVVVNAGNRPHVEAWLLEHPLEGAQWEWKLDHGILAVQGPQAVAKASALFGWDFEDTAFMQGKAVQWQGKDFWVTRTGYTGEDGLELLIPADLLNPAWDLLLEAGCAPCGLAVRDLLRTECGLSLYGHELNRTINPVQAGLSWTIGWDKAGFSGKAALLTEKATPTRRMIGLKMTEKAVPRAEQTLWIGERSIGVICSGTHSLSIDQGIALALVDADCAKLGTEIEVEIRGSRKKAIVARRRFVERQGA
jgi:aminomethyltransferase